MAERWTGKRVKADEAAELGGFANTGYVQAFDGEFHNCAYSGNYEYLYLDAFKYEENDIDTPVYLFQKRVQNMYAFLKREDAKAILGRMRTPHF